MDRRKSAIDYKSDGSKKVFNIPFVFLDRKELKVYQQDKELEFDFISDGKIILKEPVEKGKYISFRRETLNYELKHSYKYNEVLKSKNINDNKLTIFHSLEEFSDLGSYVLTSTTEDIYKDIEFNLNATIINVKDPENDNELLNLRTVNNVILSDLTNQYNIIDFENMLYDYINNNLINSFNVLYWENKIKNDIRTIDYSIISEQEDVITETFEYLNIQPFRDTHVTPYINEISNYTWKTFEDYKIEIDEEFLKPEYIFDKEYYSQEVYNKFNYSNELNIGDTILSSRDERNTETVGGVNKWIPRENIQTVFQSDYPELTNHYPQNPQLIHSIFNETSNILYDTVGDIAYNFQESKYYFLGNSNNILTDDSGTVNIDLSSGVTTGEEASSIALNGTFIVWSGSDTGQLFYANDYNNHTSYSPCTYNGGNSFTTITDFYTVECFYVNNKFIIFGRANPSQDLYVLISDDGIDFNTINLTTVEGIDSFSNTVYTVGGIEYSSYKRFAGVFNKLPNTLTFENNNYIINSSLYITYSTSSTSWTIFWSSKYTFNSSFNLISEEKLNPIYDYTKMVEMNSPYSPQERTGNLKNEKMFFENPETNMVYSSNDGGYNYNSISKNNLINSITNSINKTNDSIQSIYTTVILDDKIYFDVFWNNAGLIKTYSNFNFTEFKEVVFFNSGNSTNSSGRRQFCNINNNCVSAVRPSSNTNINSFEYTIDSNITHDLPAIPNPNNKTKYYTKGL